ncbi:hypothetical protein E6Q11_06180 [Candidatus Dojkabacteria bacterium]|uniref:Phage neck terminator protein gp12-like domain-containing protein n=1 Tax=Candidatus Dojkabacteria bacterium TaxID=2099670 RepID=A0A5C7J3B4_9BACT|nr:MAG: hypothetical protein E6Q11_06180 [Candidatus Dojkabacteria bacterium]
MNFAWDFALSAIEGVFSKATGIPFSWNESLRRLPRTPLGVLSLADSRSVGRDGHRYTFRDSNISLELYGYRELTINVQIRARLAKTAPSSRVLAEIARLALANPMYRDELRSAGLVFVETHPLLNLDFSRTVRKELRSSFDVVFRLLMHEKQQAEHVGFFDSVALSEHVQ